MSGRKYIAQQDNTSIPNIPIPQKLEYVSPEVRDKMWNLPKHSISTYRESVLPTNIRNIQKRQEENRQLQIQDAKNVEKALPVIEAGLDVASLIPAVGAVGKGASFVLKQGVKQAAKQAAKQTVNQVVKHPVQTAIATGIMLTPSEASASNFNVEFGGKSYDIVNDVLMPIGVMYPDKILKWSYKGLRKMPKIGRILPEIKNNKEVKEVAKKGFKKSIGLAKKGLSYKDYAIPRLGGLGTWVYLNGEPIPTEGDTSNETIIPSPNQPSVMQNIPQYTTGKDENGNPIKVRTNL